MLSRFFSDQAVWVLLSLEHSKYNSVHAFNTVFKQNNHSEIMLVIALGKYFYRTVFLKSCVPLSHEIEPSF